MQATFFYLERFMKKLADDQCSSITKGSIYHIKPMYIQPFTTVMDDQKLHVEWKYLLFFIFADTAFLLGTADICHLKLTSQFHKPIMLQQIFMAYSWEVCILPLPSFKSNAQYNIIGKGPDWEISFIKGACSNTQAHPSTLSKVYGDIGTRSCVMLKMLYVWSDMHKICVV